MVPDPISPKLIPFAIFPLWAFVLTILARVGGWSKLATKYATEKTFPDKTKGWQSAIFKVSSSYNSCVWIGCDFAGIYMKTGPLFFYRLGHPPLFIPWNAFASAARVKLFWRHYIKFVVRDPDMTFFLSEAACKDSMQYLYDNKLLVRTSD